MTQPMIDKTNFNIDTIQRIYCIGIGGIGLSAIARMMQARGKKVSGSDLSRSAVTDGLTKLGIEIFFDQDTAHIPADTDLVIYTVAIGADNPDLVEAKKRGIPTLTYPEMLAVVSRNMFTIAVAGTHGKTTTTAMIAQILIDAGLDPTVIVGSLVTTSSGERTNCIIGSSKYFVVEACEYKRSFLNLHPTIAVITNVDADHLDYYGSLEGVQKGFREFADKIVPEKGLLVCNPNGTNMRDVVERFEAGIANYTDIPTAGIPPLRVPGVHNIENAKAAFMVAHALGISDEKIQGSLAAFKGTWRRFEFLGTLANGTVVYDDYGHHPTEVRATLAGARRMFLDKKITVVFQPHLYSRTKEHLEEFAQSFNDVDRVIVAPIYAAREPADPSISSEILAEHMRAAGRNAGAGESFEAIEKELRATIGPNEVLMTMGAGDVNTVALRMLQ